MKTVNLGIFKALNLRQNQRIFHLDKLLNLIQAGGKKALYCLFCYELLCVFVMILTVSDF